MRGKIIKGIAGFYYVRCGEGVYECKARGVFRRDGKKPLVGDDVELNALEGEEQKGSIVEILPRSSELIRPAVANVDQALVIFSIVKPQPNFNLLDRFLIMMRQQNIPCVVCFNKKDLDEAGKAAAYEDMYRRAGCGTLSVSAESGYRLEELKDLLRGKTTTVAGPSGVGKSSLINRLQEGVVMETGGISRKIERGRHTTRHSELIEVERNTYILDTPGFSSLGLFGLEKEELAGFYQEFSEFEEYCRFGGCSHIGEPACGVRDGVEAGRINRERYENYCLLYRELKERRKY